MDHASHNKSRAKPIWKNPLVIVCVMIAGYWVYTYHAEHALGFLPYAILLLCPFMHFFMHGGHGHGGHGHENNNNETSKKEEK